MLMRSGMIEEGAGLFERASTKRRRRRGGSCFASVRCGPGTSARSRSHGSSHRSRSQRKGTPGRRRSAAGKGLSNHARRGGWPGGVGSVRGRDGSLRRGGRRVGGVSRVASTCSGGPREGEPKNDMSGLGLARGQRGLHRFSRLLGTRPGSLLYASMQLLSGGGGRAFRAASLTTPRSVLPPPSAGRGDPSLLKPRPTSPFHPRLLYSHPTFPGTAPENEPAGLFCSEADSETADACPCAGPVRLSRAPTPAFRCPRPRARPSPSPRELGPTPAAGARPRPWAPNCAPCSAALRGPHATNTPTSPTSTPPLPPPPPPTASRTHLRQRRTAHTRLSSASSACHRITRRPRVGTETGPDQG